MPSRSPYMEAKSMLYKIEGAFRDLPQNQNETNRVILYLVSFILSIALLLLMRFIGPSVVRTLDRSARSVGWTGSWRRGSSTSINVTMPKLASSTSDQLTKMAAGTGERRETEKSGLAWSFLGSSWAAKKSPIVIRRNLSSQGTMNGYGSATFGEKRLIRPKQMVRHLTFNGVASSRPARHSSKASRGSSSRNGNSEERAADLIPSYQNGVRSSSSVALDASLLDSPLPAGTNESSMEASTTTEEATRWSDRRMFRASLSIPPYFSHNGFASGPSGASSGRMHRDSSPDSIIELEMSDCNTVESEADTVVPSNEREDDPIVRSAPILPTSLGFTLPDWNLDGDSGPLHVVQDSRLSITTDSTSSFDVSSTLVNSSTTAVDSESEAASSSSSTSKSWLILDLPGKLRKALKGHHSTTDSHRITRLSVPQIDAVTRSHLAPGSRFRLSNPYEPGFERPEPIKSGKCWIPYPPGTKVDPTHQVKDRKGSHEIYYEVHGNGKKKALLIMGLGNSSLTYTGQIQHFCRSQGSRREDYQICVFDNRGVGNSDCPKGPWTTSQLAEDAKALLDYLGWTEERNLDVVGVSLGGMIALELATRISDRLSSLTLCVTSPGHGILGNIPPMSGLKTTLYLAATGDKEKRANAIVDMVLPSDWLDAPYEMLEWDPDCPIRTNRDHINALFGWRIATEKAMTARGNMLQSGAVLTHRVSPERLRRLNERVPKICILTGDYDPLVNPNNSYTLNSIMTNAELVQWEGTGHAINVQRPTLFNELLERVWDEGRSLVANL